MKKYQIKDPDDYTFPFGKEIWFDPSVYFHGTSLEFSNLIENDDLKLYIDGSGTATLTCKDCQLLVQNRDS